jgi:hypothetical protein
MVRVKKAGKRIPTPAGEELPGRSASLGTKRPRRNPVEGAPKKRRRRRPGEFWRLRIVTESTLSDG